MADAGDLGKLPPEIRKEIFTYLLVEPDPIAIRRLLQVKGKRDQDTVALRSRTVRSSAVLRANKLIREEAAQVLYGSNKFEFLDAVALHHFLRKIGDARKHLRHVAIYQDGPIFVTSWKSMRKSVRTLASAKGLRTLEVSHATLCRNDTPKIQIKDLVHHFKPLLKARNDDFAKNSLNTSVLDIIKISSLQPICTTLGLCRAGLEHQRDVLVTDYTTKMYTTVLAKQQCGCLCSKFEDENNKLKEELKKEIAKQLKLELP